MFALQAGREIRVIVKPSEIGDDEAVLMSHEIAREIEQQIEYPGQIRVTVIRESRATEFAKCRGPAPAAGPPNQRRYSSATSRRRVVISSS